MIQQELKEASLNKVIESMLEEYAIACQTTPNRNYYGAVKDEFIKFLRHIGDDVVPDDVVAWAECEGQGAEDSCPDHEDCGLCRFEYMKRHGWLSQQLSLEM